MAVRQKSVSFSQGKLCCINLRNAMLQGVSEAVKDLKVMLTMMKASKTRRWERVDELEADACVLLSVESLSSHLLNTTETRQQLLLLLLIHPHPYARMHAVVMQQVLPDNWSAMG
eukprot:COSAG02_NODE_92_length_37588_cov_135.916242_19_plen_115_part_00